MLLDLFGDMVKQNKLSIFESFVSVDICIAAIFNVVHGDLLKPILKAVRLKAFLSISPLSTSRWIISSMR